MPHVPETNFETVHSKEAPSPNERIRRIQGEEADFRDRDQPEAIQVVSKEMKLSESQTGQLIEWETAFLVSMRSIWAQDPSSDSEAIRKGKAVARLRLVLDRKEKRLLGSKYYEFTRRFAREMNRRRWLRGGRELPPPGNDITTD